MAYATPMCYGSPMRAYLGQIDPFGPRRFLAEDAIPLELVGQIAREWSSPSTATIRAVLADEDAELLRREIRADAHGEACSLLLDRAVEVHEFVGHAPRILQAARWP